jgi:WD40 repeat protein
MIALPHDRDMALSLAMEQFSIVTPELRTFEGSQVSSVAPLLAEVVLLRGEVPDVPGSHAYLAISRSGLVNGYVSLASGLTYYVANTLGRAAEPGTSWVTVRAGITPDDRSSFAEFCGVVADDFSPHLESQSAAPDSGAGPRLARVAIDTDQEYFQIFGNATDAGAYILQLMGGVSDIYEREVGLRLVVDFMRLWPGGGEPFTADALGGFRDYWQDTEDLTGLSYVHLFSGRRGLPYGGVAYIASACDGGAFGISGYLNGSFSNPLVNSSIANWDLIVVAHEMGHNSGTLHTHDGYTPTIDECGNGAPARGTIMSYCHIHPGYTSNIDLRFHRRVQEVVESATAGGGCLPFDCNTNGVDDTADISSGTSSDTNGDLIPDECQDCDGNGTLDPVDLAGGAADINGNGILDLCEDDCNGNGLPDHFETTNSLATDLNGNNIPDLCEPDCDVNGNPDFDDIAVGTHTDYDRNTIPDICQDCNGNLVADWIDLGRPDNLFIAELSDDVVREYHAQSGVPIKNYGGSIDALYDCQFGPDRLLYLASFGNSRILRTDPELDITLTFVNHGAGGLAGPAGLTFGPDGHLYVSNQGTNSVLKFDGTTGVSLGTFVSAGSGGLTNPFGLEFGPGGNLFVTSSDHSVIEYEGTTGTLVGTFVTAGSGGLSQPRGMAFKPDGNLLVASYATDEILEYDGTTGSFVRVFNDLVIPTAPWGVRVGPNGNVFVVRNQGTIRVLEYHAQTGRYYRSFVRGDNALAAPTGLDFRPPLLTVDCNGNGVLDSCDIGAGTSVDLNSDGIPDECAVCRDTDGDGFGDPGFTNGLCPEDNCPAAFNPDQTDSDSDGVGDSCDVCSGSNDLTDSDADGTPDGCDVCAGYSDDLDADSDGFPDGCDACHGSDDVLDADGDGVPDGCDMCPGFADSLDADSDGAPDSCDNCPAADNADQANFDGDAHGDACDLCPGVDVPGNLPLTPGDCNHDMQLTSADIIYIVNHIFKSDAPPAPVPEVGDTDCSGRLSSADIIVLVNHIFKSGTGPCDMCALP